VDSIFQSIRDAFSSKSEVVLFAVVVGGAFLFSAYLVIDGCYHRLKWQRLHRRFKEGEASDHLDDRQAQ
jgi:hypothetical protein